MRILKLNEIIGECQYPNCTKVADYQVVLADDERIYCSQHVGTIKQETLTECDCCGRQKITTPTQDIEEGLNGPVYDIYSECSPNYTGISSEDDDPEIDYEPDEDDLPDYEDE